MRLSQEILVSVRGILMVSHRLIPHAPLGLTVSSQPVSRVSRSGASSRVVQKVNVCTLGAAVPSA